jgi:glycosyltransferase involved in cell wall biosynthesis
MRVAMISPLEMRVPPPGYGGSELIVSLLTEEFVRRGHDVTLFASGDSVTGAKLVPGCERYLRGTDRKKDILTMLSVTSCMERAGDFDIIHNHTTLEGLATAGLVATPMLSTLHGGLGGDWLLLFERYRGWYNTISRSAKSLLPDKSRFAGVIYNAIDVETFPFNAGPRDDYLLYLSRISREKGTHLAIEVARRAGRRLVIAGNIDDTDRPYFESEVLPRVDGDAITYVGEANSVQKRELFANAQCLLAPITWNEPFGLFMAEAMACGTPVVAFRMGSVPEVVEDGVTGYVVTTVGEMVEALDRLDGISPEACRRRVEERFSTARMADDYMAAYEQVLEASRVRRGVRRVRRARPWGVLKRPHRGLPAQAGSRVT